MRRTAIPNDDPELHWAAAAQLDELRQKVEQQHTVLKQVAEAVGDSDYFRQKVSGEFLGALFALQKWQTRLMQKGNEIESELLDAELDNEA